MRGSGRGPGHRPGDRLLLTAVWALRPTYIPLWLSAPAACLALILTCGALLSPARYPYPFLDVDTYSYAGALTQALTLVSSSPPWPS